jgi:hypothetical protein
VEYIPKEEGPRSRCCTGRGEGLRSDPDVEDVVEEGVGSGAGRSFWRRAWAAAALVVDADGSLTFRVFSLKPRRLKCSASSVGLGIPGKLI